MALLMIRFLQLFLRDVSPDKWDCFFLAYDNMCNIDRLKLLQSPLALPGDFSMVWKKINKTIDSLHIKNHKRSECHVKYNPEDVKNMYPDANLMTCEQVFCWIGRYKKILNSTPKTHFHFLLHRLIIGRNRYTEYCYRENRYPLLPSVKMPKGLKN